MLGLLHASSQKKQRCRVAHQGDLRVSPQNWEKQDDCVMWCVCVFDLCWVQWRPVCDFSFYIYVKTRLHIIWAMLQEQQQKKHKATKNVCTSCLRGKAQLACRPALFILCDFIFWTVKAEQVQIFFLYPGVSLKLQRLGGKSTPRLFPYLLSFSSFSVWLFCFSSSCWHSCSPVRLDSHSHRAHLYGGVSGPVQGETQIPLDNRRGLIWLSFTF